jgi:Phosphatidylinositol-specific phospholipase C, X domain
VIGKFAFIVTPYPLILSMEIHCGAEQQAKMAKIFRETLGRELLLEPLPGIEEGKLPSPEDLKHKILLKVCIPRHPPANESRSRIPRKKWKKEPIREQEPLNPELSPIPSLPPKTQKDGQVRPVVNSPAKAELPNFPRFSPCCQTWRSIRRRTNGKTSNYRSRRSTITSLVFRNQRSRNSSRINKRITMSRSTIYDI